MAGRLLDERARNASHSPAQTPTTTDRSQESVSRRPPTGASNERRTRSGSRSRYVVRKEKLSTLSLKCLSPRAKPGRHGEALDKGSIATMGDLVASTWAVAGDSSRFRNSGSRCGRTCVSEMADTSHESEWIRRTGVCVTSEQSLVSTQDYKIPTESPRGNLLSRRRLLVLSGPDFGCDRAHLASGGDCLYADSVKICARLALSRPADQNEWGRPGGFVSRRVD